MKTALVNFAINRPRWVIGIAVVITLFFAAQFPRIQIDTDPQNMLRTDEPVRLWHQETKEIFELADFLAVGVVAEEGAFTPPHLNAVYRITAEIATLDGVIVEDILAPSTVDDIRQGDAGELIIEPLMGDTIATQAEADYLLSRIVSNPILRGKLASDDGAAIALFIPIESKDISFRLAGEIQEITDRLGGDAEYHIAGLPVAEDSFGAEMFTQMALSAPLAFVIIFLLMVLFFRKAVVVLAPMIVAMMAVIWAMGLLILTGNTVHIMSSMIPVFLIPIAVLNSIHILSEFHDRFAQHDDKSTTMRHAITELFFPLLFTSLTTIAGFVSLATTPIPPVQVFGIFVAVGVLSAWLLSLTVNPAVAMLIRPESLRSFGRSDDSHGPLARVLHGFRDTAWRHYRLLIGAAVVVVAIAGYGLTLLVINDNPVKWFKADHPIRIADQTMNAHLAGTYMNFLVFEGDDIDRMKDPDVLRYMEAMQRELENEPIVGGTTGLTDIVTKIRFELFGADSAEMRLPDNLNEVGQMLFLFEMSGGSADDLYKFATSDYDMANLWVQMTAGDNQAVSDVVARGNAFLANNPPPPGVTARWAGLPYINIEWQEQMVAGMRSAFLGSFLVVLIMMIILFRSIIWGLISMLPLTITVMSIYAFIGYIGKPYDMPVAVLSALTLGLSIDFAIHFIGRLRIIHRRTGSFRESYNEIFESAGRAILRNVLVIAIGFVPMLFSSLVPYITVGVFFLSIMLVSGLVTMLLLPALVRAMHKRLLPDRATVDRPQPANVS